MNSKLRDGRFTSSQMHRLAASLKNGNPSSAFFTYCEEVKYQRAMERSTETRVLTKPMKWGSLFELVLFDYESLDIQLSHKETIVHKDHSFWSGTPDFYQGNIKTIEVKCPQPKRFAKLSLSLISQNTETIKAQDKESYWQVVSNSILLGTPRAEIICYMPYKSEVEKIVQLHNDTNFLEERGLNPEDYYFLQQDDIETMAYLPDDSGFKNINRFEFDVPQEDIDFLTDRVLLAEETINEGS